MQSALDRRQAILEVLSDRRQVHVSELMAELNVSRCTILRDIEILSCSVPIYTVQGNGGGICVEKGYYYGRRYLRTEQEDLLNRLSENLGDDDYKIMQGILKAFAMPKIKNQRLERREKK